MFTYAARVLRVIDGDTVEAELSLGFHVFTVQRLRLARINAPETRDEGGAKATATLSELLACHLVVETKKKDSFGRWIAEIILPCGNSASDLLVARGCAVYQKY